LLNKNELKYAATVHLKKYYDDKKCEYTVCDLRDPKAIRATIKRAAEFLNGTVDVLVNNVRASNRSTPVEAPHSHAQYAHDVVHCHFGWIFHTRQPS
jgi:NAD(P)-dependent dehydrogenase (short-subunit alcohol dehydrogenase family)